jgi:death-on-curing protein
MIEIEKYKDVFAMLSKESPVTFLTKDEVVIIHDAFIERFGGSFGIRDDNLLSGAINRPLQFAAYSEQECDLALLGAVLCEGIIRDHAFVDGNKRTGLAAALQFWENNALSLHIDDTGLLETIVGMAKGVIHAEEMADRMRPLLTSKSQTSEASRQSPLALLREAIAAPRPLETRIHEFARAKVVSVLHRMEEMPQSGSSADIPEQDYAFMEKRIYLLADQSGVHGDEVFQIIREFAASAPENMQPVLKRIMASSTSDSTASSDDDKVCHMQAGISDS